METTIKVQKNVSEHIQKMLISRIEEKRELARKFQAGELDYLKNNATRRI